jgi:hypothetical protein
MLLNPYFCLNFDTKYVANNDDPHNSVFYKRNLNINASPPTIFYTNNVLIPARNLIAIVPHKTPKKFTPAQDLQTSISYTFCYCHTHSNKYQNKRSFHIKKI